MTAVADSADAAFRVGRQPPQDLLQVAAVPARWLLSAIAVLGTAAALALLETTVLAALVGGTIAAVLIAIQPLAGIALILASVPFGSLAETQLGSFSVGPTEPLVALTGLVWLARGLRDHRLTVFGGALVGAALCMIALLVASVTYAMDAGLAVKESLKWIELLVVLIVVADLARTRARVTWLLAALLASGVAEAAWGVAQFVTGGGPSVFQVDGVLRAFGTFEQPNPFAGYLGTILPISAMLTVQAGLPQRQRVLYASATLALALGVLLSQSRGAWLGLGAAALTILMFWSVRSRRVLAHLGGAAVLIVIVGATGLLPSSFVSRLGQTLDYFGLFDVRTVDVTSENWSVVERMAHWQAGWMMFEDHPWLGVGAGNYAEAYPSYYLADWTEPLGHAHNYYLNTLAESGLVGGFLLLLFLALIYRRVFLPLRSALTTSDEQRFWRALLAGLAGSMIVFTVHNFFDNLFVHGVNAQLGFLVALAVVAGEKVHRSAPIAEVA